MFTKDATHAMSPSNRVSAIDRAIEHARKKAHDAERALSAKMARSMRDLTNKSSSSLTGGRERARGGKSASASDGTVPSTTGTTTTRASPLGSERKMAFHAPTREPVERTSAGTGGTWMDEVVREAKREAESAERRGGRTMAARAASTVAAVTRGANRDAMAAKMQGRTQREADNAPGDSDMMDASPDGRLRRGVASSSPSSPRYRQSDVEAIKETLKTDYENALKLMRDRAEAAEREVMKLSAKCGELEDGKRSARSALAEMASQNEKLVNAFSMKKEEVRALKEKVEASVVQADIKAQNNELREALQAMKLEAKATAEKNVNLRGALNAAQEELNALRGDLKSNEGALELEEKLAAVMGELEREREAFAMQKASWKQERARLVRLAANYSPQKSRQGDDDDDDASAARAEKASPPKRSPTAERKKALSPRQIPRKSRRCPLREEAEELKIQGNQKFHAKSYEAALQAYADALAVDFDDQAFRAVLHANKAAALQAMGRFCEAVMECCVSRTFDATYIRALQRRADAYLSMGDWPMAMKDLEELTPHMGEDCAAKLREAQRKVKNGATSCEHYAVLGVSGRATQSQVSKAYKSLALKFHPDKASCDAVRPASEALFKRVAEAYAVLKDASKRASYDANLAAARLRRTYSM